MCSEVRVNKEIADQPGLLSCPESLDLEVRFDLMETQDFSDGVAGGKFSYGNLRFVHPLTAPVAALLMSHTRLALKGGGIQTTVCFNQLDAFTVVSAIQEDLPAPGIFRTFRWVLPLARLLEGRRKRRAASAWTSHTASAGIRLPKKLSPA